MNGILNNFHFHFTLNLTRIEFTNLFCLPIPSAHFFDFDNFMNKIHLLLKI